MTMDFPYINPTTSLLYSCFDIERFDYPHDVPFGNVFEDNVFHQDFAEFASVFESKSFEQLEKMAGYMTQDSQAFGANPQPLFEMTGMEEGSPTFSDTSSIHNDIRSVENPPTMVTGPSILFDGPITNHGLQYFHNHNSSPTSTGSESPQFNTPPSIQNHTVSPTNSPATSTSTSASSSTPVLPTEANKPRKRYRKRKQPTDEERELKRVRFLERNRTAAAKCRTKKKGMEEQMQEQIRMSQAMNAALKAQLAGMRDEVEGLKGLVAVHNSSGGCTGRCGLNVSVEKKEKDENS